MPFTPARPNQIVTSLKSDKVVFPGPPLRPPERVTILVILGAFSETLRTITLRNKGFGAWDISTDSISLGVTDT